MADSSKVPPFDGRIQADARPNHVPKEVVENEQIYSMLMDSLTLRVNEQLDQKLARQRASSLVILGLAATFLVAIGGFIGKLVLDIQVSTVVREQLQDEIGQQIATSEFLPRRTALQIELKQLERDPAIRGDDAERLLVEFEDLYKAYARVDDDDTPDARRRAVRYASQLNEPFEVMARILAATEDQDSRMDRLIEIAPEFAERSVTLKRAMTLKLGIRLIGSAGGMRTWQPGEANFQIYENYKIFSNGARSNGWPEYYYLFTAIIWMIEERDSDDLIEMVNDIEALDPEDAKSFVSVATDLVNGCFKGNGPESERCADRARQFVTKYADKSDLLSEVKSHIPDNA